MRGQHSNTRYHCRVNTYNPTRHLFHLDRLHSLRHTTSLRPLRHTNQNIMLRKRHSRQRSHQRNSRTRTSPTRRNILHNNRRRRSRSSSPYNNHQKRLRSKRRLQTRHRQHMTLYILRNIPTLINNSNNHNSTNQEMSTITRISNRHLQIRIINRISTSVHRLSIISIIITRRLFNRLNTHRPTKRLSFKMFTRRQLRTHLRNMANSTSRSSRCMRSSRNYKMISSLEAQVHMVSQLGRNRGRIYRDLAIFSMYMMDTHLLKKRRCRFVGIRVNQWLYNPYSHFNSIITHGQNSTIMGPINTLLITIRTRLKGFNLSRTKTSLHRLSST